MHMHTSRDCKPPLRATASPISGLCDDALFTIFTALVDIAWEEEDEASLSAPSSSSSSSGSFNRAPYNRPALLPLLLVCKHWNNLVAYTPTLWTRLRVSVSNAHPQSPPHMYTDAAAVAAAVASTLFVRALNHWSGAAALADISLDVHATWNGRPTLEYLTPHLHRVRRLQLTCGPRRYQKPWRVTQAGMGAAEAYRRVLDSWNAIPLDLLLLHTLAYRGPLRSEDLFLPAASQLTKLVFRDVDLSLSDFRRIGRTLRVLEVLTVTGGRMHFRGEPMDLAGELVAFASRRLARLDLCDFEPVSDMPLFFRLLQVPDTCRVTYECAMVFHYTNPGVFAVALLCSLRTFLGKDRAIRHIRFQPPNYCVFEFCESAPAAGLVDDKPRGGDEEPPPLPAPTLVVKARLGGRLNHQMADSFFYHLTDQLRLQDLRELSVAMGFMADQADQSLNGVIYAHARALPIETIVLTLSGEPEAAACELDLGDALCEAGADSFPNLKRLVVEGSSEEHSSSTLITLSPGLMGCLTRRMGAGCGLEALEFRNGRVLRSNWDRYGGLVGKMLLGRGASLVEG